MLPLLNWFSLIRITFGLSAGGLSGRRPEWLDSELPTVYWELKHRAEKQGQIVSRMHDRCSGSRA